MTQDIRPLQILVLNPDAGEDRNEDARLFHVSHLLGRQAGLYYHDGIHKHDLQEKLFGVFPHMVARRSSMFMRGFDDTLLSRRRYRSMMAVSKGTPLNRGTCSVTSPEVVVGLRS